MFGDHFCTSMVCGNKFKICWTCEKSAATSWKKVADTYEHYAIYVTVVLFTRGQLTKDEAMARLENRDLTNLLPNVQKYIDQIFE